MTQLLENCRSTLFDVKRQVRRATVQVQDPLDFTTGPIVGVQDYGRRLEQGNERCD